MVAYSFKKQFGPPILAGTKAQTIRADRKRHARPGEMVQLFTGMRTRQCRRLGESRCVEVLPVRMAFSKRGAAELMQVGDRYLVTSSQMDAFARADGFTDLEAMARFWWAEHPPEGGNVLTFEGILIRWQPLVPADALDIAGGGMTKRAPKPLPPPTDDERRRAGEAAQALRTAIADPSTMGAKTAAHVDLARPRRGEWWESWANLPGFHRINGKTGRYIHALLPDWSYTQREIRAEMIPDLEALAERGERPTEDTSGRAA